MGRSRTLFGYTATSEHVAAFEASRAFEAMASSRKSGKEGRKEIERGQAMQAELLAALRTLPPDRVWMDRREFTAALDQLPVSISMPVRKAILASFSERDENAAICKDSDGNIEPDPELRDTENVPLKEDIHDYFEREVRPHVPDAWIDEEKTKIGYEIPLTRHFYKYTPPRPLEAIEKEIRELEGEIVGMLAAVAK